MKKIAFIWLVSALLISCQEHKSTAVSTGRSNQDTAKSIQKTTSQVDGEALLKQYCTACHLLTPDPSKRDKMAAPPFMMVVQHYKSTYPSKDAFVNTVVKWANHPTEDDVLMPGAVRHFGLMPPMPVGDENLKAIAAYLYQYDFGNSKRGGHRGRMFQGQTKQKSNQKATLDKADLDKIKQSVAWLKEPVSDVAAYQELGKKVFNTAKTILLNPQYKDQDLAQVQAFFHGIEDDMHQLMAVKTKEDGEKYRQKLLQEMQNYKTYFK